MPAPLTIVIPTLNAASGLPGTLMSLMEGIEAGMIRDLVVSDGGSTDATIAVAEEAGALLVTGAPGRGGQIARGTAEGAGNWLLILHADTELSPGWTGAVRAHIANAPTKAGYFQLRFRAEGAWPRLVAGWANLRSRAFKLPYGDQGLLIARDQLAEIGGYPDLPLMEDVAIARRIGADLTVLGAEARTSAKRYETEGWFRRGARNWLTLARYFAGADPAALARAYGASDDSSSSAN